MNDISKATGKEILECVLIACEGIDDGMYIMAVNAAAVEIFQPDKPETT